MNAYRVVSQFLFMGQRISPPADFVPPTQEIADRLVAAKCLKERVAAAMAAPLVAPPAVEALTPNEAPARAQEVAATVGTPTDKKQADSARGRFGGGSKSRSR